MVEGAGLENRYIRKGIAGSNPALSARYPYPVSLNKSPYILVAPGFLGYSNYHGPPHQEI